jgi:hypothetical protein
VRPQALHGTDFGGMLGRFSCAGAAGQGDKGMTPPVGAGVLGQMAHNLSE